MVKRKCYKLKKKLTNVSHGLISKLDTTEKTINELKDRSTGIAPLKCKERGKRMKKKKKKEYPRTLGQFHKL